MPTAPPAGETREHGMLYYPYSLNDDERSDAIRLFGMPTIYLGAGGMILDTGIGEVDEDGRIHLWDDPEQLRTWRQERG